MRGSLTRLKKAIWATNMAEAQSAPSESTSNPAAKSGNGTGPPPRVAWRIHATRPSASTPCKGR